MTIDDILLETEEKMQKTEDHVVHEFAGVRTGKASPALLENIMVEAYGSNMRLKELATIAAPESRMLTVTPFDQTTMKGIEKGIQSAGLGLNPAVQGRFIRVVLPDLSTERRQELVKLCKRLSEDGRVAVRNIRRDARKHMESAEKASEISADDLERAEKELEKITHDHVERIDAALGRKEEELLEV